MQVSHSQRFYINTTCDSVSEVLFSTTVEILVEAKYKMLVSTKTFFFCFLKNDLYIGKKLRTVNCDIVIPSWLFSVFSKKINPLRENRDIVVGFISMLHFVSSKIRVREASVRVTANICQRFLSFFSFLQPLPALLYNLFLFSRFFNLYQKKIKPKTKNKNLVCLQLMCSVSFGFYYKSKILARGASVRVTVKTCQNFLSFFS